MELGTIITTIDGPSPYKFTFVGTENGCRIPIRQGEFVEVETEEGWVMAFVTNLIKLTVTSCEPNRSKNTSAEANL